MKNRLNTTIAAAIMKTELLSAEALLDHAGIRVTAVRILILKAIRRDFQNAFSLADLEASLPSVDRSTLFRTLTTLTEAHLLHEIDDGTGAQKYCLCHHDGTQHCPGHVHLTCIRCHRTYCLTSVEIPSVPLPEGFQAEHAEYVVKGLCAECLTAAQNE